jgi:hypothetical protein
VIVGETWDGTQLAAWTNQSAPADTNGPRVRETIIDGTTWLEMGCFAGDVAPLTPNSNPRAQLHSPFMLNAGETYQAEIQVLVNTTAIPPTLASGKWVELVQLAYGSPYAGSPPLRIMTQNGSQFGVRECDGPYSWQSPASWQWRAKRWKFVFTWLQSPSGWYSVDAAADTDLVHNVVPQKPYATIQASNGDAANALYLDAYMAAGTATHIGPVRFTGAKITRLA